MKPIVKLAELTEGIRHDSIPTVAVAAGQDPDTILAIDRAVREHVVQAILVGQEKAIEDVAASKGIDGSHFQVVPCEDPDHAAMVAVALIREGRADMLMKGLIKTSSYMKAILNKEEGLLSKEKLLSHVAVFEIPSYPKLLIVTDAAVIPLPTLEQKVQILEYAADVSRRALGVETPKAAVISAAETVSPNIPSSMEAAVIAFMGTRKQITDIIVDGPLAVDVAISREHCEKKGFKSSINGEADILLFPNIESANAFYKCSSVWAGAKMASMVVGTEAPVVLTSRADSEDTKFYSIALAARMASIKQV